MGNDGLPQKRGVSFNTDVIKYYLQLLLFLLLTAALLFCSSGNTDWIWAWIYILIFSLHNAVNAFILPEELLAERASKKGNVKKWDKILTAVGIIPGFGLMIVLGLNERYGWEPRFALYAQIIGLVFYILGDIIVSWAMASNMFFSSQVRIQSERGHKVATEGPYRYIRHPGYFGIILNAVSTPLIFGSVWAFIPAIFVVVLFIIRMVLEDSTLRNELEGYDEFSQKVRFKLLPGIW